MVTCYLSLYLSDILQSSFCIKLCLFTMHLLKKCFASTSLAKILMELNIRAGVFHARHGNQEPQRPL